MLVKLAQDFAYTDVPQQVFLLGTPRLTSENYHAVCISVFRRPIDIVIE